MLDPYHPLKLLTREANTRQFYRLPNRHLDQWYDSHCEVSTKQFVLIGQGPPFFVPAHIVSRSSADK